MFTPPMEKMGARNPRAASDSAGFGHFPNWDAVVDGSRSFHVYCCCDDCIDGLGAAREQGTAIGRFHETNRVYTSAELRSTRRGVGLIYRGIECWISLAADAIL